MDQTNETQSVVALIEHLVSRLPDTGDAARALRRRLADAGYDADGNESGTVADINATVMAILAGASGAAATDEASAPPTVELEPANGNHAPAAPGGATTGQPAVPETPVRPEPRPEPQKWTDREKLLYRDIIHLFELGDHSGAMASLERLFMLAPAASELSVFVGKNESTLLKLYRDHIGSMDRVLLPSRNRKAVGIPTPDPDLMLKIIRLSDGHRPIREFVRKLDVPELQVLMVISHLARSGYLEIA